MKRFVWIWLIVLLLGCGGSPSAKYGSAAQFAEKKTTAIRVRQEDPNTILGAVNGRMVMSSASESWFVIASYVGK